ncbi:MAG: RNA polymerase sigma factor [Thermoleophilia bacterium]|nr:RNA polymerase sigma factor [Thermoleophilia bacterium]
MMFTRERPVDQVADAALMRRASAGDASAYRVVFERHVDAIRGYAISRVGRDDADDIVSETFATAWRTSGRFDSTATSVAPWLYGIATNGIAKHRDREQRWINQPHRDHGREGQTEHEPTAFEIDPALAHAISKLSPPLRDTLLLTALADFSVAETGRALGISATTARVRLLRARRQARHHLEGERHDQP